MRPIIFVVGAEIGRRVVHVNDHRNIFPRRVRLTFSDPRAVSWNVSQFGTRSGNRK